ncbi:Gfo/Idh/MocA family protein [Lederbergia lenta]|uniref:Dehydrogenase n=1 Tax=Lederbergia lenta TaxID=1467 RepID=A0A2X4W7Q1_LEDLE|nr:Gfo/Idh/MocA family oxidoreductase [Lederbergia lenta]MCM3109624.1 Gfo/Idh/MocA family oxidoreductase [Lederbergia lenta]MEC2324624.1 Gfo/Idh/MocA family oxidoreductase [Lederbergia lenta]SQI59023.1 dehydrogenase [Lederbergia lenta]
MSKIKIGIIGCGNISSIYMQNIPSFDHLELVACADLDVNRARAQAEKYQLSQAYTVKEILADPNIDLIINLTIPKAHAEVCIQVLEAGKHVYVEKPLAVTREEGKSILDVAQKNGLLVGSAPDTFLGAGIQTALHLIESGEIGVPIGASAFMIGRGHEHWHPDPAFYYDVGGGPMFDMGPYYLTALIALLGPIKRLSGLARISYPERTILSEPKAGTKINVSTATHISGTLDFDSGAIGTITTSFDAFGGSTLPPIEIYGSEGTLLVPDPNTFGGSVKLRKRDEKEFIDIPLTHNYDENSRGIGVADMANAIQNGTPHRANGQLAYHVLEAMHGFHDSSESGAFYHMQSTCEKPEPFPVKHKISI